PYSATNAVGMPAIPFLMEKPSLASVSCNKAELFSSRYPISARSQISWAISPYFWVWASKFLMISSLLFWAIVVEAHINRSALRRNIFFIVWSFFELGFKYTKKPLVK